MTPVFRRTTIPLLVLAISACASREAPAPAPRLDASREPHRVVDAGAGAPIDFAELAGRAAGADVVVFGEQHDDPGTHRLQRALLEALAGRRRDVVLSLEMFERDAQPALDDYLAGRITEEAFLAGARPWPNYATDYRPLVELARERGWPVVAANVPRRYAALVARGGLDTLRVLPAEERAHIARDFECPRDAYYERFMQAMGAHPGGGDPDAALLRYYHAQCIKDETMAESIAAALAARPDALVVHLTGAFHSDYGHGVPARVARRRPGAELVILTAIPVEDLDRPPVAEHRERADFLVFTRRPEGGAAERR